MKIESVVENIVNIVSEWRKGGKSFYALISDSGYYHYVDAITEDMLKTYLLKHEEQIGIWIQWSEDKRTSSGWFIIRQSETSYDVGFLQERGGHRLVKHFSNKFEACAHFIYEEIRQSLNK